MYMSTNHDNLTIVNMTHASLAYASACIRGQVLIK